MVYAVIMAEQLVNHISKENANCLGYHACTALLYSKDQQYDGVLNVV